MIYELKIIKYVMCKADIRLMRNIALLLSRIQYIFKNIVRMNVYKQQLMMMVLFYFLYRETEMQ